MKNRILSLCLVLFTIFLLGSCGKGDDGDSLGKPIVASSSVAGNVSAAKAYANSINARCIEFSSDSDAVVSVVNGKADYVILDEYAGCQFLNENNSLYFYEKCDYGIEYRACFSRDDAELCNEFNNAFAKLQSDGTIEKIKSAMVNRESYFVAESAGDKGTLVMLCAPIYDNRLYFTDEGGITGTDVYIAKEVCNYLGYTLVLKNVNSEDLFTELDSGNGDFIMSCMERTEQRAEHYLFSNVYATYDYNVYKLK